MLDLCYSSVGSIFSEKAENVKLLWFRNIKSAQFFFVALCEKVGWKIKCAGKKMGLEKKWTGKKGLEKRCAKTKVGRKKKWAEKKWVGKKCSCKKNGTEQKRGWIKCVPEKKWGLAENRKYNYFRHFD